MAKKFATAQKKGVDRKMKIGVIIILILLFMGFSIAGYYSLTGSPQGQQPNQPQQDYGTGTAMGTQGANVGEMTGSLGVFGQLDSPVSLAKRLNGELFVMNNGASNLIFTNAAEADIKVKAKGEYIIYKVARCDTFECLVDGPTNDTVVFDVYRLDRNSSFVASGMVGLPSSVVPVTL